MKLYMVRHGRAAEKAAWTGDDDSRPLTERGVAETAVVAAWLASQGVQPDALLTSPLVRAAQTADMLAEALDANGRVAIESSLGPGFDIAACLRLLDAHAGADALVIVGHEPSFSEVAGELIGGARLDFKKSGVALIDFARTGPPDGLLRWLVTPRLLASPTAEEETAP